MYGLRNVALHGLTQLRVDLIGNRHDPQKQDAEVNRTQVFLQCMEEGHLKNTALFHHHRCSVPLPAPLQPMIRSRLRLQFFAAERFKGLEPSTKVAKKLW